LHARPGLQATKKEAAFSEIVFYLAVDYSMKARNA
jgi:hypothetical protein